MTDKPKRTRRRARDIKIEVLRAIEELVFDGYGNASEIARVLKARHELLPLLPSDRTIARAVSDLTTRDTSEAWSPAVQGGGRRMVLDVLAELVTRTEGRIRCITVAEAECMIRLEPVTAKIPPIRLWRLARLYARRIAQQASTEDLDAYVAFAPWRGLKEHFTYDETVKAGWIPAIPEPERSILGRGAGADCVTGGQSQVREQALSEPESSVSSDGSHSGVSNPVSNDARSATGRGRPKRPGASGAQEVTDGSE